MIGVGIGLPFYRSFGSGVDAQAQAHFNRVIADGGVVPSGLSGVNAFFSAVKAIYGTTDINTAISAAYDAHYLGYKLGAGSGTTLGQAAQKLYAPKGIFGGIGTGSAYWEGVGVVGNNVTTPAIVSPTTQLDVVSYVYASTGHTGAATIISNDGPNRNFVFNCQTVSTGILQLRAGTPFTNFNSTTGVGNFDNYTGWIRATYNQNGANGDVTFYTSTNSQNTPINSITWVQLGSVVSSASTGLQTGSHQIQVGSNQNSNNFTGRIGIAAFSTSIGGSPSVLFNANQYTGANTWTSTTSEVWTVNSTGAGLADVVQTTAASQPLLLAHTGENYWFGSGVTNNFVSTPNAAANQITGDIEIVARISISDEVGEKTIISKRSGANASYVLSSTSKLLRFRINTTTYDSNASHTFAVNEVYWAKVTRQQSNGEIKFFTSLNGTTWTQLGTTIIGITDSIAVNSVPVIVGVLGDLSSFSMKGNIYRATIANSIGGTPVVDFNPASYNPSVSQTQWTSATGEVWSINTGTATSGYKSALVDRSLVQLDRTDDSMSVALTSTMQTSLSTNCGFGLVATRFTNSSNEFVATLGGDFTANNSTQVWLQGGTMGVDLQSSGTVRTGITTTGTYTLARRFSYVDNIVYGGTTTQVLNATSNNGLYFNNTTNKPTITSGNFVLGQSGFGRLNGNVFTFVMAIDGTKFNQLNTSLRTFNNNFAL